MYPVVRSRSASSRCSTVSTLIKEEENEDQDQDEDYENSSYKPVLVSPRPCSASILLDSCRIPVKSSKTVLITTKPPTPSPDSTRRPKLYRSVSDLASKEDREANAANVLSFAPLPDGRMKFRSNSLSIGVAARAGMIKSQGGGSNSKSQPRYTGPQQWYQPGGAIPPDVYTYKDASAALSKVWSKLKRKGSDTSTSSSVAAAALALEKEGKGPRKSEEMIEDIGVEAAQDLEKRMDKEDSNTATDSSISSKSDSIRTPTDEVMSFMSKDSSEITAELERVQIIP